MAVVSPKVNPTKLIADKGCLYESPDLADSKGIAYIFLEDTSNLPVSEQCYDVFVSI